MEEHNFHLQDEMFEGDEKLAFEFAVQASLDEQGPQQVPPQQSDMFNSEEDAIEFAVQASLEEQGPQHVASKELMPLLKSEDELQSIRQLIAYSDENVMNNLKMALENVNFQEYKDSKYPSTLINSMIQLINDNNINELHKYISRIVQPFLQMSHHISLNKLINEMRVAVRKFLEDHQQGEALRVEHVQKLNQPAMNNTPAAPVRKPLKGILKKTPGY